MKKYIYTFCFTLSLLNSLTAQTADDLQNIINATDTRTLTLTNDVVFDFGRFGTTLGDDGALTLIGNVTDATNNPSNAYTLTSSTGAFLKVFDTSTLNLSNIKISGNTSTGANFITNNGTLNISNSIFSDNLNGQGSSVISNTGNLFIDSSLFENNTVAKTDSNELQLGRGGAVRNSGTALITNTTFRANGAQHGSAIYNLESGIMEVIGSTFEGNKNTNTGSGYAYGSIYNKGTLIVSDSVFQNNTMGSGGAIYNEGITTIYDSTFTSNSANGLGGALTNASGATLTVHDSLFEANEGSGASAAINSAYGGNLNIIGSTIQNHTTISDFESGNYDRDNGGAIYFYGQQYHWDNGVYVETIPSGHLYIQDSQFLNNTVSRGGGAIYNAGYATLINTVFEGNVASLEQDLIDNDAATAGAFYDYNQTDMPTTIKDSKFLSNTAYSAGAIYHPTGHLIIDNTLFDNNSAISVGSAGALQNGGANSYLDITNSIFSNNYAGHGGAIFHQSKNAMNISGTVFDGNIAESFGGAFYAYTHEIVKGDASTAVQNYTGVTNSTFRNNNAGRGGAIYALSKVDVVNSLFENNSADGGGAIYVGSDNYYSGIVTISNSSFIGNSSGNGGAISSNGELTITDSHFENNTAGGGAAIYNQGTATIYNSLFKNNVSTYSSSYTYATASGIIDGNGTTNIFNSSFTDNYHNSANTFDYSAAITGRGTVNIIANDGISFFSGNTSNNSSSSLIVRSGTEMNLYAGSGEGTEGSIVINDGISIFNDAHLHINKENGYGFSTDGIVEINDEVKHLGGAYDSDYFLNLHNGTLKLGSATVNYGFNNDGIGDGDITSFGNITDKVTFNVYGGKLSTVDGNIRNTNLGNLVLHDDVLFDLDIDLDSALSDIPTAASFNSNEHSFLIDEIHLFEDTEKMYTEVLVSNGSIEVALSEDTIAAYTPMYRYEIEDSRLSSDGVLVFTKDVNTFKGYNPSLYASTIALISGNYIGQVSNALRTFSAISNMHRNVISVTPYFSYDSTALTDGYVVENLQYGSSVDFSFAKNFLLSASYAGSNQTFEKTSILQNGGAISLLYTLHAGNFYLHSMIGGMGNNAKVSTMYGKDSFPTVSASAAFNCGYSTPLGSMFLLIPNVSAFYGISKAFGYTTTEGISIQTNILHSFQAIPSLRFESQCDNTLLLFAHITGNFSFLFGGESTVNGFLLPNMTLDHYIQYGIGIRKSLDKLLEVVVDFSGYSLSKNGIALSVSVKKAF